MKQTSGLATKHLNIPITFVSMLSIVLIILSLLAILKSIFISFDIDEGYAIAQSYRLLTGDRLLAQMWEPHQFSAFFSAIIMYPFLLITRGSTTGIIIYLRIIGSLIHLLIGFWLYSTAKRQYNRTTSLLIALIHINFLPKWVSSPEFEVMHYWAVCVLFLALHSWQRNKKKKGHLILASVALWIAIMSYPTMIILYPIYVIAILYFTKGNRRERLSAILWFTLPVFLLGISLLGYLFSYMTFPELLENISYILMDESHSNSLAFRVGEYWKEIKTFTLQLLMYMSVSFLIYLSMKKLLSAKKKDCSNISKWKLPIMLLFTISMLSVNQLISSVLGDSNQFYLYIRFLVFVLFGISCSFLYKKGNQEYWLLGIYPGLLSVLASAAITNMTLEIALARIYIAVIASCFLTGNALKEKLTQDKLVKGIVYIGAVLFLFSLLMSKLLLVRVTGCIPISIKMHMKPVTAGPAAGLLLKEELADSYNANTEFIRNHLTEEDCLLYFGCENIYYLASDAELATPSTQGTAVFNEMYLHYYEKYPEKLPTVVIIDKTFDTNPDYNYSYQNQIVLDWIMEEFEDATIIDSEYMTILRK